MSVSSRTGVSGNLHDIAGSFAPRDFGSSPDERPDMPKPFSYGEAFGTNSQFKGMRTGSDPNLTGMGHGSFTSWEKLNSSPAAGA